MTTTTTADDQLARAQRIAKANEYIDVKVMNGKIYGVLRFIYTTAIMVGVDEIGYQYRYCYPNYADALADFATWDGNGDPPGNWIKRKGRGGDFANPNYSET